ncbi:unnamed protein product [Caenorhabditis nigoni]
MHRLDHHIKPAPSSWKRFSEGMKSNVDHTGMTILAHSGGSQYLVGVALNLVAITFQEEFSILSYKNLEMVMNLTSPKATACAIYAVFIALIRLKSQFGTMNDDAEKSIGWFPSVTKMVEAKNTCPTLNEEQKPKAKISKRQTLKKNLRIGRTRHPIRIV